MEERLILLVKHLLFYLLTFRLCPVVLINNVTELNLLAGNDDLLKVSELVLPLLLKVHAVAIGKLNALHLLVGLRLQELDFTVLRKAALTHPGQKVGSTVVQGLYTYSV